MERHTDQKQVVAVERVILTPSALDREYRQIQELADQEEWVIAPAILALTVLLLL